MIGMEIEMTVGQLIELAKQTPTYTVVQLPGEKDDTFKAKKKYYENYLRDAVKLAKSLGISVTDAT
jgi:hypothetical protein